MENVKEQTTEVLNNLVEINNDRIEGYEKAISLLPNNEHHDLRDIFQRYKEQSIQFNHELEPLVYQSGDVPTEDTRASGKLFRTWMAIRSAVSPSTVKSILESCERGEDEFKKVYNDTLGKNDSLGPEILTLIYNQADLQLAAHDHIKSLRDNTPNI